MADTLNGLEVYQGALYELWYGNINEEDPLVVIMFIINMIYIK